VCCLRLRRLASAVVAQAGLFGGPKYHVRPASGLGIPTSVLSRGAACRATCRVALSPVSVSVNKRSKTNGELRTGVVARYGWSGRHGTGPFARANYSLAASTCQRTQRQRTNKGTNERRDGFQNFSANLRLFVVAYSLTSHSGP